MAKKLPPWTASSIEAFTTCPHKYYRLRVARDVKDLPRGEAALWGDRVHKIFENAINWGAPLPDDCKQWNKLVEQIKAIPGEKMPEKRFSIDKNFQECKWGDAWARGAADLVVLHGKTAVIFDYKTGKQKPSDQLSLYAGFAFAYWPHLEKVHTIFVWLKDKELVRDVFTREDIPNIWNTWVPLVNRLERCYDADDWPARPSGLCKNWCPVTDCKYCGV